jgi:hypothetical protein
MHMPWTHRLDAHTIAAHPARVCCPGNTLQAKEHVEGNVALAAGPQLTPKLWQVVHKQIGQVLSTRPVVV